MPSPVVTKQVSPDLYSYGETLKARRTVHFFEPEIVPVALIQEAIAIARWAPNHRLTEPWHFYILGENTISQVVELITDIKSSGSTDPNREAIQKRLQDIPGWLLVTCKVSADQLLQQEDYAACACAVQNMMLYLWQAGVGVKWTTGSVTRDQKFFDLLDIDKDKEMVVGLFWYGDAAKTP